MNLRWVNWLAAAQRGELAKRLRSSFARVVLVATLCCALLLLLLTKVATSVRQMQHHENAIRGGLALAVAIREQYIHAAHTIVVGDHSHVDHYTDWVRDVSAGANALRPQVPVSEHWRLERLAATSRDMDRLFRDEIVPSVLRHDSARLRAAHAQLERGAALAAEDADAIARATEAMMAFEHVETTHITYLAAAVAMLGIIGLIGLAAASTRSLQLAVLTPLGALASTAKSIGAGD